jgi:hypothetical protein
MNKERMERYLSALREGKYKQCRKAFRSEDGELCAVSVGLQLMVEDGLGEWIPSIDDSIYRYEDNNPTNRDQLQIDMLSGWLGYSMDFRPSLIKLNDDDNLSLPEIADVIEKEITDKPSSPPTEGCPIYE